MLWREQNGRCLDRRFQAQLKPGVPYRNRGQMKVCILNIETLYPTPSSLLSLDFQNVQPATSRKKVKPSFLVNLNQHKKKNIKVLMLVVPQQNSPAMSTISITHSVLPISFLRPTRAYEQGTKGVRHLKKASNMRDRNQSTEKRCYLEETEIMHREENIRNRERRRCGIHKK